MVLSQKPASIFHVPPDVPCGMGTLAYNIGKVLYHLYEFFILFLKKTFSCNLSDFGFHSAFGSTAKAPLQVSSPAYVFPVNREPLNYVNIN